MKKFKHERFCSQYCPDKINGDFFWVNVNGIDYEMSLGHAKQLTRWIDKIVSGLRPKRIKFKKHPLAGPPQFCREEKYIFCMGYNTDVWFTHKQAKRLSDWLKNYEKV